MPTLPCTPSPAEQFPFGSSSPKQCILPRLALYLDILARSMVPPAIQAFLHGAMPRLRAQERLVGVASGGSWISGEMDERSDLDLVLVTQDDAFPQVMQERMQLAKTLGPLLVAFTGEHVGEPRLLICLYGPSLLHVDLKFMALRDFGQRVENPDVLWERNAALTAILAATQCRWPVPQLQWIEDRFWVWREHSGVTRFALLWSCHSSSRKVVPGAARKPRQHGFASARRG